MKKILTIVVAALLAVGVSAKEYQYSLGMVAGLGMGVQFKDMVKPNFTIIDELGYFTCPDGGTGIGYGGFIDNLVLAYQDKAAEGEGIRLDWYVGGQIKVGYGVGNMGVIGVGAAGGIEAIMKNAPIAFSFDFRPGYACALIPGAGGGWGGGGVGTAHMFDWSLNLGVRYTF